MQTNRLPDHVSFEAAALLEPLSVAIHAVNRACPAPGSTALVMGAGTVGLLTAAMARQSGCTDVTIADVDAGRVDYALKHGFATHGYIVSRPLHPSSSSSSIYTSHSGASTPSEEAAGGSGGTASAPPAAASTGYITPPSVYSSSSSGGGSGGSGDAVQQQLAAAKALAADVLALARREQVSSAHGNGDDDDDSEDVGVDVAFECTGKESCTQTCLYAARPGGKLVMVGMGTPIQTMPLSAAHLREVDILGIFRYAGTYPTGIRLLCAQGLEVQRQKQKPGQGQGGFSLPSLDAMVTHRFKGLDAAKGAFELASRTVDDDGNLVLKVIIEA
jgi:L-iditol 2-dehydrogenase